MFENGGWLALMLMKLKFKIEKKIIFNDDDWKYVNKIFELKQKQKQTEKDNVIMMVFDKHQTEKDNVIMMVFDKHYKHDDWSVKKKEKKKRAWVMVTKNNPLTEAFMDQRV